MKQIVNGWDYDAQAYVPSVKKLAKEVTDGWVSYTPNLTWGGTAPANIVVTAKYKRVGTTIFFAATISFDAGSPATSLYMSLPKAILATIGNPVCTQTNASGNKYAIYRGDPNNDIYISTGALTSITWVKASGTYEMKG